MNALLLYVDSEEYIGNVSGKKSGEQKTTVGNWLLRKKYFSGQVRSAHLASSVLGIRVVLRYTPSPHTSESLDWHGFRKNGVQNLERVGVRSQNLDFKELTVFFEAAAETAHALTMICFPREARKVRCHKASA